MYDDGLHEKASDYASNRRDGYLAQMQLGKVKKKTQDELNWIWVAHYEGYKEGCWAATGEEHMKPIAWYDPSNGVVSTDRDSPLFTPLGQVWPLYVERTEQEPVAYLCENAVGHRYFRWKKPSSTYKPLALYTSPQRTWVGLTDDEVYKIAFALEGEHWKKIADAIESKIKEKNT